MGGKGNEEKKCRRERLEEALQKLSIHMRAGPGERGDYLEGTGTRRVLVLRGPSSDLKSALSF